MCISQNVIKVYNKYTRITNLVPVPCNHCYECVRKRKLDWELRLTVESSASAHTFFGMLTFNDECYHSEPDSKEIKYYIMRLRYNLDKFYPGATLKYFCVSELGELKDRLHYHILYMVSSEFDDTHREFEELCRLSWVKKVPLSEEQIIYRKKLWSNYRKNHKDKLSDSYIEMRKFCHKKYDDISLGFVSCQMLRGGTAVGSIHYACKYIQKQYNKKYHSRIGFDVWRRHMVNTGQLEPDPCFNHIYKPHFKDYPTFPVNGFPVPVPRRWMLNTVGKYLTSYYVSKMVKKLSGNEKNINSDKVHFHWHKEPERLSFLADRDAHTLNSRKELLSYRDCFANAIDDFEKWQIISTPKPMQSCLVEVNSTCPTEIPLPLKWVN